MKILVFSALICCLQSVHGQSVQIDYTSPAGKAVIFNIKQNIQLNCTASGTSPTDKYDFTWFKKVNEQDTPVEELRPANDDHYKVENGELVSFLKITNIELEDAGLWTCSLQINGTTKASTTVNLASNVVSRIKQENINVVEENKLRIECNVIGKPDLPLIAWKVQSEAFNGSLGNTNDTRRYLIKDYKDDSGNNVTNGLLVIDKVEKVDRGEYFCEATNLYDASDKYVSKTFVRVKDKYAAVWPFLGIVAEVIILCAIIIIYEKKRNKTELEESDTDQSPDQKNTPDHGKDSNVRHRQ